MNLEAMYREIYLVRNLGALGYNVIHRNTAARHIRTLRGHLVFLIRQSLSNDSDWAKVL